jgi:aconitate hydratase
MKQQWNADLGIFGKNGGAKSADRCERTRAARRMRCPDQKRWSSRLRGPDFRSPTVDVVIAAITSCTNTSNPDVMMAAGLVARKARELGLERKPWVKSSLAPWSQVVTEYLTESGLLEDLEALGFGTSATAAPPASGTPGHCRSRSPKPSTHDLVATSVLSGNRNFEGRISPDVRANYLASPPLVVAYALAGTVNWDPIDEPIGQDRTATTCSSRHLAHQERSTDGHRERPTASSSTGTRRVHRRRRMAGDLDAGIGLYDWNEASTYVQEPPFFTDLTPSWDRSNPSRGPSAGQAGRLGDHRPHQPGRFDRHRLPGRPVPDREGCAAADVQLVRLAPGQRPGDDPGTFANIRVRNRARPRGPRGLDHRLHRRQRSSRSTRPRSYQGAGTPAGGPRWQLDYGMGSSRDWAAKGAFLLGVKAVIAKSSSASTAPTW